MFDRVEAGTVGRQVFQKTLSEAVEADSHRIVALHRRVTVGVILVALAAALVLALTGACVDVPCLASVF